jgi:branched-subunit amino acid ABC-type transport system permease component
MQYDAAFWFSQVLNGLQASVLLMLITIGLTIIFGILLIVNFAHGSFYMIGAYLAVSIISRAGNFWAALVLAPIIVGLGGALTERFIVRPMRGRPVVQTLLLTFGLALILDDSVRALWGPVPFSVSPPEWLQGTVRVFGISYPSYRLFIMLFGAAAALIVVLLLEYTTIGTVVRAASSDHEMVEAMGINTSALFLWVFALGAGLAAMSGVVAAPLLTVTPGMGASVIIDAFVILVLGGLGSLRGTVLAALIVGQIQTLGAVYLAQYASVLVFVLMGAVLLVRPRGILNLGRVDDGH